MIFASLVWLAHTKCHVGLENVAPNTRFISTSIVQLGWGLEYQPVIKLVYISVYNGVYDEISVDENAYSTPKERELVTALIEELKAYKKKTRSTSYDSKFSLPLKAVLLIPLNTI